MNLFSEKDPVVSFLITVYNKAPYLEEVLASVYAQTGSLSREFVIINDGSTDNSLKIIQETCKSWERCTIHTQENSGVVQTTINGIKKCSGEFIKFVDGDDLLLPGLIEKQLSILLDNPMLSFVSCSFGFRKQKEIYPHFNTSRTMDEFRGYEDVVIFDECPLMHVLSRPLPYSEAITGHTGGLSRKSTIDLVSIENLQLKFNLHQMQDHLISSCSLLDPQSCFAHINCIGFIELSFDNGKKNSSCVSSNTKNAMLETVIINYAQSKYLSKSNRKAILINNIKIMAAEKVPSTLGKLARKILISFLKRSWTGGVVLVHGKYFDKLMINSKQNQLTNELEAIPPEAH